MLKSYHSRAGAQGEQDKILGPAALGDVSVSLVCAGSLPDDGLAALSEGQQFGRLINSEFLQNVESQLSYLPGHQ